MADEYPRDEFDQIAESAGPVGVHRAPRPWWILVVTPIVVFIVAGLLAFLIAQLLWNSGESGSTSSSTPSVTASTSASPSASASASASASPSASATPEPSETSTPEPVVEYGAAVAVLNGTGIGGLAAGQQGILEDAGFTAVSASNLTGTKPDVNTVVYADDAMADTAQAVADALGFDAVVQGDPTTDADVEVQIVSDPR